MDSSNADHDETARPQASPDEHAVLSENPETTDFDLTRRELLTLAAVTGSALMADSVPVSAAPAMAEGENAPSALVNLLLRVNGAEHRLTLDPRTTLEVHRVYRRAVSVS